MLSYCSVSDNKKNLGSAKSGYRHWISQRFSAIMVLVLAFFVLLFAKAALNTDVIEFIENIKKPHNSISIILFITFALYHGMLGMQVVIEDYISCVFMRFGFIIFMRILVYITICAFLLAMLYVIIV